MNQKIDNLSHGDLIVINYSGYLHNWSPAIFLSYTKREGFNKITDAVDTIIVSITFKRFGCNFIEHINTRNSRQQRVYKITEDNLTRIELNNYLTYKGELAL